MLEAMLPEIDTYVQIVKYKQFIAREYYFPIKVEPER